MENYLLDVAGILICNIVVKKTVESEIILEIYDSLWNTFQNSKQTCINTQAEHRYH